MFFDFQKASMLKRISARILDLILVTILATGFGFLVSAVSGYDNDYNRLDEYYQYYEREYSFNMEMTEEEYNQMSEEDIARVEAAYLAMAEDEEMNLLFARVINLSLLIVSLGILLAFTVTDFVCPLLLKNGQTVGKKIFGIGVMNRDQTRLNAFGLAIRTFLGRYTLETMIPVLTIIMIFFGFIGIGGTIVLILMLVLELVSLIATETDSALHDLLAGTAVVDFKSQMIFDNAQAKEEYKTKRNL